MLLLELFSPPISPALLSWFGDSKVVDSQGRPLVLYHGTGSAIDDFDRMVWGSISPALAGMYAGYRGSVGGTPNIMPIYMRLLHPFDVDKDFDEGDSLTINQFVSSLLLQSPRPKNQWVSMLVKKIKASAREEESGPHYRRQDFWYDTDSFFGRTGALALRHLFGILGFDGVKMTEKGELTYGAFSPTDVRSAVSGLHESRDTYPARVDANFIEQYIRKMHEYNGNYYGFEEDDDLLDRIHEFDHYELKTLNLEDVNRRWATEPDTVDNYSSRETDFPPIVYDPIGKSIIDGSHRTEAAIARDDKTIRAYVGVKNSN